MMRLLLVMVVACGAALLAACGAPKCAASNCVGCCDANGTCQAGSTVAACGLSGSVCTQCLAGACVNGLCGAAGGFGGGGGTGGGTGGAMGGGTGGGGATASAVFQAFNLAIAGATLPASCYRGGVLPPNPTLAPRTLEVLVWNAGATRFIALGELGVYQLGDSPAIRPPSAVEGLASTLSWLRNTQTPISDQYTEARQTQGSFTFADLTASSTTGTLALNAQYACIRGRADCPVGLAAPVDAASCDVRLSFSAQAVPLTAKWTSPETLVTGATKYLVAIDFAPVRTIAVPACFRNNNLPAGRGNISEVFSRELDVWQVFTIGSASYLRTSRQTVILGDAPTIRIDADLSSSDGGFALNASQVRPVSNLYVETRSTAVTASALATEVVVAQLALDSTYSCVPGAGSCPVGDMAPADAASCRSNITAVAVRLP